MFENQHLGHIKYIKVIKGQKKYLIEDFKNLTGCYVFATKKSVEALMIEISSDHYDFESFENNNFIRFEEGFPIDDYYSFKVIKPDQIISIPYNFNTISSITPESLNSNFQALKETLKRVQLSYNNQIVKIDSDEATVMLPNLDDDEVWVRKGNTYRGFNIGNLEANVKEMLDEIKRIRAEAIKELEDNKNKHLAEIQGVFDREVADGKSDIIATGQQQIELVTDTGDTKIVEINNTFNEKNALLIKTGDTKNQELINTFNEKNTMLEQMGDGKKQEFEDLTQAQLVKIENKGNEEVQRVTAQGDIEVQRVIDAGVEGKVNRNGDTMTNTLKIDGVTSPIIFNAPETEAPHLKSQINGVNDWYVGRDVSSNRDISLYSYNYSKGIHIQEPYIYFDDSISMAQDKNITLRGSGKVVTANNYGVYGYNSDGSNASPLIFNDINNRIHLGWNKENNIIVDGYSYFWGTPQIETESPYIYFKDLRAGASDARSYIGFGSNTQKFQIVNAGTNHTTVLELDSNTNRIETNTQFYTRDERACGWGDGYAKFQSGGVVTTGGGSLNKLLEGMYQLSSGGEWFRTGVGVINDATVIYKYGVSTGSLRLWYFNSDGSIVASGNMTAFSDKKLKKDFKVIPNALDKIQAINGYTYTRKDSGERQAGVVAQEIQKVLPEVVLSNKDEKGEETLSVAYGNIVALLIEGIKEQQKKIDSLEERLSDLEKLVVV